MTLCYYSILWLVFPFKVNNTSEDTDQVSMKKMERFKFRKDVVSYPSLNVTGNIPCFRDYEIFVDVASKQVSLPFKKKFETQSHDEVSSKDSWDAHWKSFVTSSASAKQVNEWHLQESYQIWSSSPHSVLPTRLDTYNSAENDVDLTALHSKHKMRKMYSPRMIKVMYFRQWKSYFFLPEHGQKRKLVESMQLVRQHRNDSL